MKSYERPIIEEELIEIEDIIADSPGVTNDTAGWDNEDDNGGDLGDIFK